MKAVVSILFLFTFSATFSQSVATYTYAIKSTDALKLDVYTPENIISETRLPVVIWMHGGGFSGGARDGSTERQFMKSVTDNGFKGYP